MRSFKTIIFVIFLLGSMSATKLRSNLRQSTVSTLLGPNLVINGDFSNPKASNVNVDELFDAIPGWTGTAYVEIGEGKKYNNNWESNNQVAELDTFKNTIISQIINLPANTMCQLSFRYAGRDPEHKISGVKVLFNEAKVFFEERCHGYIQTAKVSVNGQRGANVLSFAGTGPNDGKGVAIDDVILRCEVIFTLPPNPPTCDANQEYIINGGFEEPNFHDGTHLYPTINGWSTYELLEIGGGKNYSPILSTQVLSLDAKDGVGNSIVFQEVYINRNANCRLSFQHTAEVANFSASFSVYLNDVQVFKNVGTDTRIHSETLNVTSIQGVNYLKFKGEGTSDGQSTLIDNVSLKCDCGIIVTVPDDDC